MPVEKPCVSFFEAWFSRIPLNIFNHIVQAIDPIVHSAPRDDQRQRPESDFIQIEKPGFEMADDGAGDIELMRVYGLPKALDKGEHFVYRQLAGLSQRMAGNANIGHTPTHPGSQARRAARISGKKRDHPQIAFAGRARVDHLFRPIRGLRRS
ncbi:hypothetical protein [Cohnella sp. REN36]|uniref:hypothetical protein n=1 Tax=Cohnella sp. REN36 TaxID=2887347 RepID=UPI001D13A0E8|nr:hypothetical protein [Cohnella sp. REN36]MCC3373728.1 hypothetical protein [Cohnella sp. REN36]